MKSIVVAASLVALVAGSNSAPAAAQSAATELVGPPSSAGEAVRTGPLPARLSLAQAMEEADARSPRVVAAEAEVEAARGRQRQAGRLPEELRECLRRLARVRPGIFGENGA